MVLELRRGAIVVTQLGAMLKPWRFSSLLPVGKGGGRLSLGFAQDVQDLVVQRGVA